jgi:hypothetical protein
MKSPDKFAHPCLMGIALGCVLLASFLITGHGLGASGAVNRIGVAALDAVDPQHVANNPYLASNKYGVKTPLDNFYVFMIIGVFIGGAVSAYAAGRMKLGVIRGPRIGIQARLFLAFFGGIIMGIAARIGRGCTSGQALSGGALMSVGAWAFMLMVFVGGYSLAYFIRRQWI